MHQQESSAERQREHRHAQEWSNRILFAKDDREQGESYRDKYPNYSTTQIALR